MSVLEDLARRARLRSENLARARHIARAAIALIEAVEGVSDAQLDGCANLLVEAHSIVERERLKRAHDLGQGVAA